VECPSRGHSIRSTRPGVRTAGVGEQRSPRRPLTRIAGHRRAAPNSGRRARGCHAWRRCDPGLDRFSQHRDMTIGSRGRTRAASVEPPVWVAAVVPANIVPTMHPAGEQLFHGSPPAPLALRLDRLFRCTNPTRASRDLTSIRCRAKQVLGEVVASLSSAPSLFQTG
jgi:hypothetical protein